MPLQISRVRVALAVFFLTLEVVYGRGVQRSAHFQPMLPPLGRKDRDNASTLSYIPLGEHSSLFKRDFSAQISVSAPVPGEAPPCGATGCINFCCTAEQNCCLTGCMPDDGSVCHQTGYCEPGWDVCGATACYPLGVGATCCSTSGTYCEAGYQCSGNFVTGFSCDVIGGETVSSSTTTSSLAVSTSSSSTRRTTTPLTTMSTSSSSTRRTTTPLPAAPSSSSSTSPTTPEATLAETTPLPPAMTIGETTVLQPSTTTNVVPVEPTAVTSGATPGSSIAQSPTTEETTVVVPASTSASGPSTPISSNTSSSGGQRTVARSIEMLGWVSIGMVLASHLAARF